MNSPEDKKPEEALNPLIEICEEKESEILDIKNSFLDDDAIADNVILSEPIADDVESNKFQLLYIEDEIYYLIQTAENGEIIIVDTYPIDEKPDKLTAETTLFKLIASAIEKTIDAGSKSSTTKDEAETILNKIIESLNHLQKDKKVLKELLLSASDEIKEILNEYSVKISEKVSSEITSKILKKLSANREPSVKLLADYLNYNGEFFLEYETQKRYMMTERGFEEVNVKNVSTFFNKKFGYNEISAKKSKEVLGFITRNLEKNYDLIQFKNGTLNTRDEIFSENTFYEKVLPKLTVPFNYVENAEKEFKETDLFKENHEILKSDRWSWNEELFYKCVGSCGMAINEIDKLMVIVGEPNSRKSTLLAILKRIFNYSEIKLQTIAENPRFQLLPCIAKDINIDDDMQNFRIGAIGFLNSFVSGNGGEIEIKGENVGAKLTAETTPRIIGASNTLPSIIGDGFERRLILLLAENHFTASESKKSYMQDIKDGKRDEEIGLMFSYCLQEYFKTRSPITTPEQEKKMMEEWEWKSYPAKKGAEIMFIDEDTFCEKLDELKATGDILSYKIINKWQISIERNVDADSDEKYLIVDTYVPVKEVNKKFKNFYKLAFERKKIFKEGKKASTKVIKSAMGNAGFDQVTRTVVDEDGNRTSERVYEDCIFVNDALGFSNWERMF